MPVVLVGPVVGRRRPGRPAAGERHPVGVAADRPAAGRPGAALPPLRRGHPRGAQRRAGLRLRPPRRAGAARRGGHPADRRRPSASCSTPSAWRCGCRPTSTRSRGWSSPPRTARSGTTAPATPTTSSAGARWPAADGPVLVSLARADDEEAAALGPPRRLRPARRRRSSPRPASRATSRSATGAATSSPSPTATGPRWTRCSPTSTPRSGSSSCSPRSATTPTTTGSPACPTGSGWPPRSTRCWPPTRSARGPG